MNRRTFFSLGPALLTVLAFDRQRVSAQATPVVPSEIPQTYAEVADAYEAARERALTEGRLIGDQFFGGDIDAIYPRTSVELQSMLTVPQIEESLAQLTTNRLSFAAPDFGFFFDGQLEGDIVSGFLVSDASYGFSMQRNLDAAGSPTPVATPYDGSWSGTIQLGDESIAMTVEFAAGEGTIAFPEIGIDPAPLSGIAFDPERQIGERVYDQGLPLTPTSVAYAARYAWGDRALSFVAVIEDDGTISMLQVAPEAQLPPDPSVGYVSEVTYQLPFDGLWWVFWGGETTLQNYHAIDRRQRHAVDLLIWKDGATYRTDGAQNTDYWIYGQPVLAPADGVVVAVFDEVAENAPGSSLPDVHPGGNHVIVQTAPEEFVILAHLQPSSIGVIEGDRVNAGQVIGLAGNSGNSSEPHLHIHLQNEIDFFSPTAIGLPLVFRDLAVNGQPVESATLEQGAFVNRQSV
jgi:hypothetical protein